MNFRSTCLLVAFLVAPAISWAQGTPTGSTNVKEPPDSAYHQFLTFIKSRGATVSRTDSTHHRFEAKVKGSEEPVIFTFTGTGDSTSVDAQGSKGGMAALIIGLGEVNDWLESRRAQAAPARRP